MDCSDFLDSVFLEGSFSVSLDSLGFSSDLDRDFFLSDYFFRLSTDRRFSLLECLLDFFTDLSDFSDFSDFADLPDFSDFSDLADFSDLSDCSDYSDFSDSSDSSFFALFLDLAGGSSAFFAFLDGFTSSLDCCLCRFLGNSFFFLSIFCSGSDD